MAVTIVNVNLGRTAVEDVNIFYAFILSWHMSSDFYSPEDDLGTRLCSH